MLDKSIFQEYPNRSLIYVSPTISFGGPTIQIIAGPCAVESEHQIQEIAQYVQQSGATLLRGGAFKPRTSPHSFQGLGDMGLHYLKNAGVSNRLPIVTELMDVRKLDLFLEYDVDVIQVGSRNMQNFDLLKELGKTKKPIILKRGLAATLKEWLLAAEYIVMGGNENIILCERGIRGFETSYRNILDITAIPYLKQTCPFPIIVDPSHAAGKACLVPALAHAAIAAGADGLLIETHPNPALALSDKEQALTAHELQTLITALKKTASAFNRYLLNNH